MTCIEASPEFEYSEWEHNDFLRWRWSSVASMLDMWEMYCMGGEL